MGCPNPFHASRRQLWHKKGLFFIALSVLLLHDKVCFFFHAWQYRKREIFFFRISDAIFVIFLTCYLLKSFAACKSRLYRSSFVTQRVKREIADATGGVKGLVGGGRSALILVCAVRLLVGFGQPVWSGKKPHRCPSGSNLRSLTSRITSTLLVELQGVAFLGGEGGWSSWRVEGSKKYLYSLYWRVLSPLHCTRGILYLSLSLRLPRPAPPPPFSPHVF